MVSSQKGGAFSSQTIQQVFRQLYTKIGFDAASSHSGDEQYSQSWPNGVCMFVLYSRLATTQRYIEVSPHLLRNAVELL
jgi:integrase/recombinase XerD